MAVTEDLLALLGAIAQIIGFLMLIAIAGLFVEFVFDEWFR